MLKRLFLLSAVLLTALAAGNAATTQVRELPEPPCWPCLG